MEFSKIIEILKGEFVVLGLIDLENIEGFIQSIDEEGEIILKGKNSIERTPVDFVKFVMILNPENN
ncbi:MAG: hypothetical protein ACFFDN_37460 [Candidatus Hodarchaeota archaeon]